ncbi:MAG: transglycosylase domain-containing protein [Nocardioidaceae bacterium]|nr:transglycosylase domain-containing protein [Nocardioidaceae bacterium]
MSVRSRRSEQGTSPLRALGAMALLSGFAGLLVAGLLIPVTSIVGTSTNSVADGFENLPLALRETPTAQRSRVVDSTGRTMAFFYSENRQDVELEQIAPIMRQAILSIEDYRFYSHGAIDVKGTTRALVNNAAEGSTQGGSTITQQLVKMTLVQQADTAEERAAATEKSPARKLRELKYAMSYEERHSKDEILKRYLNIAYFGDGAYGISAAARHYFSKNAEDLSLAESATLAGLVKNPVQYDPTSYPENALQRRNTVLATMRAQGEVTAAEADAALAAPLGLKITAFSNGCVTSQAPFPCDFVRRYLLQDPALGDSVEERKNKIETGGLTIRANINLKYQAAADEAVRDNVNPTDAALGLMSLVEPGTGKVKALAQSRPMGDDKKAGETYLNFTVPKQYGDSGGFQAGSTFKIFSLASALEKGMSVGTTINSPAVYNVRGPYATCDADRPWYGGSDAQVKNSTSSGGMNMYTGTRLSVNTFFMQLEKRTGLCQPVSLARKMGVTVPEQDVVPTFALGVTSTDPLTLANAYATFAARGIYCTPQPVADITDSSGRVIKKYDKDCTRVVKESTADQVNDILRGVQQPGGFGYANAGLSIPSAAKTGTIQAQRGVTYAGYTPDLAGAAMVEGANSKGQPISLQGREVGGTYLSNASGSQIAAPIWGSAFRELTQYLDGDNFATPPSGQPSTRVVRGDDDRGGNGRGDDDRR